MKLNDKPELTPRPSEMCFAPLLRERGRSERCEDRGELGKSKKRKI